MKKLKTSPEKLVHLAQKRTELAHERTILSYVRSAATMTLFAIGFFGLSQNRWDFFFGSGAFAVLIGLSFLVIAVFRWLKHSREIEEIKSLLHKKK